MEAQPVINESNMSNQYLQLGEFAGFSVELLRYSEDVCRIEWFHADTNNGIISKIEDKSHNLLVGPIRRQDFGVYFCKIFYGPNLEYSIISKKAIIYEKIDLEGYSNILPYQNYYYYFHHGNNNNNNNNNNGNGYGTDNVQYQRPPMIEPKEGFYRRRTDVNSRIGLEGYSNILPYQSNNNHNHNHNHNNHNHNNHNNNNNNNSNNNGNGNDNVQYQRPPMIEPKEGFYRRRTDVNSRIDLEGYSNILPYQSNNNNNNNNNNINNNNNNNHNHNHNHNHIQNHNNQNRNLNHNNHNHNQNHYDHNNQNETPPIVIMHPKGDCYTQGTEVMLQCVFANADRYQWYRCGIPLAGCEGRLLFIHGAERQNEGLYHVTAFNSVGQTSSNPTMVTVQNKYYI